MQFDHQILQLLGDLSFRQEPPPPGFAKASISVDDFVDGYLAFVGLFNAFADESPDGIRFIEETIHALRLTSGPREPASILEVVP